MAGLARTDSFMLGTATVMIGPEDDLFDLDPTNSIGLVKNFSMTSEPSYTELTQGTKNTLVFSVLTQNTVRASMEAYEFTAQNIAYALGLGGTYTKNTVTSAVDGSVSSGTTFDVTTGDGTDFAVDDYIMIKNDNDDDFIIRQIESISTDTITVNQAFDQTVADGATVLKVNSMGVGSKTEQPFYSAKIAGKLANGEPMVLLIPKLRIVQGFNLAFSSDDYGNMPFEFTVYDLTEDDTHFDFFGGDSARVLRV